MQSSLGAELGRSIYRDRAEKRGAVDVSSVTAEQSNRKDGGVEGGAASRGFNRSGKSPASIPCWGKREGTTGGKWEKMIKPKEREGGCSVFLPPLAYDMLPMEIFLYTAPRVLQHNREEVA